MSGAVPDGQDRPADPGKARRRAVLVLGLCSASVALGHVLRPSTRMADGRPPVDLETLFPRSFGPWLIDERRVAQLVSPDTEALLQKLYNQTLARSYVDPVSGERMMLSVAYGGDQSDATRAHRPEVCYPVQGFQIVSGEDAAVPLAGGSPLHVRRLVAVQGQRHEPLTYWITVGGKVTTTGFQQKLAQLSYTTRGVIPDGMLVRVSSIDRDPAKAFAAQNRFIADLARSLPPAQSALVVGEPHARG